MEDEEDLSPSGSDVVSTGVGGLGGFFNAIGGLAINGLSRRIDLEFAEREQIIDTATQSRERPQQQFNGGGFAGVVQNLTPIQIGGFVVAVALSIALVTGKFR